ncbi:MAG: hypothetical protein ABFD82_19010 [Syntrophaceae bacterium]
MSAHRIRLNAISHSRFLAEERKDPVTKEPLCAGMDIAICANDQIAFLWESWTGRCPLCGGTETLRDIPGSVHLQFARKQPRTRVQQQIHPDTPDNILGTVARGRREESLHEGFHPNFKHIVIGIGIFVALFVIFTNMLGNNTKSKGTGTSQLRVIRTVISEDVKDNVLRGVSNTFTGPQNKLVSYTTYEGALANKTKAEFIWYRNNSHFTSCGPYTLRYAKGTFYCTVKQYLAEGDYEVTLLVDGEAKDRIRFSVVPPSATGDNKLGSPSAAQVENTFKGVIRNEDSAKALYIHHPDTDLEMKIDPSQYSVIVVSKIPDNIEARFEGQQNTTHYTLFKKQGRFDGMDVSFGARIRFTGATGEDNNALSDTSQKKKTEGASPYNDGTAGRYRGVVMNENNQTLYIYHPDSGNLLTVGPGQYIFLGVNTIPEQIKGVYDMSSSRQASFNFKVYKKKGEYHGRQVEFGARVSYPKTGS